MATDKIQTGLRLAPEVLGKITVIAKTNHRSLNNQIEFLVMQCIDEFEKENGSIPLDSEG